MIHSRITVISISDPTGTMAPSAGANGELGKLALEIPTQQAISGIRSEVESISSNLQNQIDNISGGGPGTNNHNDLLNIQGGTTNEYYHLTQTQITEYIGQSEVLGISGNLYTYTTTTSSNIFNYFINEVNNLQIEIDNISGGTGTSWTPIEGNGIIITSVGDDYEIAAVTSTVYDISASGTYAPDYNNGSTHSISVTGAVTINTPTNLDNGESLVLRIYPNGNLVDWSTSYKFPYDVAPLNNETTITIMSITKISDKYYATYTTGFSS